MIFLLWMLGNTDGTVFAAEPTPILRAVTSDVNYPYNFVRDGRVQGLSVDVANELAKRLKMQLQTEVLPWTRALRTAQMEPNVLLFTVARIPEREAHYHWIGPVTTSEEWLYRLKRRGDVVVKSLDDAKRYLIGDEASNASLPSFARLGIKVDTAPSMTSNCRKFKVGRVDLIPFDPDGIAVFVKECGMGEDEVEKTVQIPRDDALYFAFSKSSSPEFMRQVRQAFSAMERDKTLQRLSTPWKGSSSKRP